MSAQSDGVATQHVAIDNNDIDIDTIYSASDDDDGGGDTYLSNYTRPVLQCTKYGIGIINDKNHQYITIHDEVITEQFNLQNNNAWRDYLTQVTQFDDLLIREYKNELYQFDSIINSINANDHIVDDIEPVAENNVIVIDDTIQIDKTIQHELELQRQQIVQQQTAFEQQRQFKLQQRKLEHNKQQQTDDIRYKISNEIINSQSNNTSNSPVKRSPVNSTLLMESPINNDYMKTQLLLQQQLRDAAQIHASIVVSDIVTQPVQMPQPIVTMGIEANVYTNASIDCAVIPIDDTTFDYTEWLQQVDQFTITEHARKLAEQQRIHDEHIAAEQAKYNKIQQHKQQIAELELQQKQYKLNNQNTIHTNVQKSYNHVIVDTAKLKAEQDRLARIEQSRMDNEKRINELIQMTRADMESNELNNQRIQIAKQTKHEIENVVEYLVAHVITQYRQYIESVRVAQQLLITTERDNAATTVQAYYKRYTARKKYGEYRNRARYAVVTIQRVVRGHLCRTHHSFYTQIKRAILLRQLIRGEAATVIQCNWRGYYLRYRLHQIKQWAATNSIINDIDIQPIDPTFYTFRPMDDLFNVHLPQQAITLLNNGLQPNITHVDTQPAAGLINITPPTITNKVIATEPILSARHGYSSGRTGILQQNVSAQSLHQQYTTNHVTNNKSINVIPLANMNSMLNLPALVHNRSPLLPVLHNSTTTHLLTPHNRMTDTTTQCHAGSTEQLALQWMQRKQQQIKHSKQKNKQLTATEKYNKLKSINHNRFSDSMVHLHPSRSVMSSHSSSNRSTNEAQLSEHTITLDFDTTVTKLPPLNYCTVSR